MYGFISGVVNNDVGVNAGAAALELLLIRMLRRGITMRLGLLTGAVLIALPIVKGTGLLAVPGRRARAARDRCGATIAAPTCIGWAALALGALVDRASSRCTSLHVFHPVARPPPVAALRRQRSARTRASVSEALAPPRRTTSSYLWQVLLAAAAVHGAALLENTDLSPRS